MLLLLKLLKLLLLLLLLLLKLLLLLLLVTCHPRLGSLLRGLVNRRGSRLLRVCAGVCMCARARVCERARIHAFECAYAHEHQRSLWGVRASARASARTFTPALDESVATPPPAALAAAAAAALRAAFAPFFRLSLRCCGAASTRASAAARAVCAASIAAPNLSCATRA